MATPFSEPINIFLMKISDLKIVSLPDAERNEIVNNVLKIACSRIRRTVFKTTGTDLYKLNDDNTGFYENLDDDLINIISEFMVVEWLKPYVLDSENLQNCLSTSDFNNYSPANLLKELGNVYKSSLKEATRLLRDYTIAYGNVEDFGNA